VKRFLIVARQESSCDNTVGCGINYWFDRAESIDKMRLNIEESLLSNNKDSSTDFVNPLRLCDDHFRYTSLDIYELGPAEYSVPLDLLAIKYKEAKEVEEAEIEAAERAEFKRLSAKFANSVEEPPEACGTCGKPGPKKGGCKPCGIISEQERGCVRRTITVDLLCDGWTSGFMFGEVLSPRHNIKIDDLGLIYLHSEGKWNRVNYSYVRMSLPKKVAVIYDNNPWLSI